MTIVLGAACGLLCLVPGVGLTISCILCSFLCPGGEVYALCVGIIALSFNESIDPASSGGLYSSHEHTVKSPLNKICTLKVLSLFIGACLGLVLPGVLGGSMLMTCLGVMIIFWAFRRGDQLWTVAMWVLSIHILMIVIMLFGVSNPIVVVSLALFTVPSISLNYLKQGAQSETYSEPDYVVTLFGSIFALCAPGVSTAAIVGTFSRSESKELSTNISAEALMEGIALTMISRGEHLGKTMIGTFVQTVTIPEVVTCLILIGLTYYFVCEWFPRWWNLSLEINRIIASSVGLFSLVLLLGWGTLLVVPFGFFLSFWRFQLPSRIGGLTFLSLVL